MPGLARHDNIMSKRQGIFQRPLLLLLHAVLCCCCWPRQCVTFRLLDSDSRPPHGRMHPSLACIARLAVHVSASPPLKHREMSRGQSGRSALEAIDLCSSQESDDDCAPKTSAAAGLLKRSSSLDKDVDDDGHDDDKGSGNTSLPKRRRHNTDIGSSASAASAASSSPSLATRLYNETTRQTPDGATVTPGIVGLLRTIPTIMGTNNVRVCGVCTQSDPGRVNREFYRCTIGRATSGAVGIAISR